ncbi:cellulose binding domain-containing protein [Arthrobacter sp. CAN_A6]|uniref:cellulose binding domain-containing protein n=1 Tax=Arthrobacter sp. CAN_A6 TaxID=2787721 RepID=UPI002FF422DE
MAGVPKLDATWGLQSSWWGGHTATLRLTAKEAVRSWSVTYADPNVTRIPTSWGMKCSFIPKTSITCVGADWTTSLKKGQTASVGLQVDGVKPPVKPVLRVTTK